MISIYTSMIKLVFLSLTAVCFRKCYGSDGDYSATSSTAGWSCSESPDNSTSAAFKSNLNILLSKLEEQGPRNNGFYMTTVGKKPDKLYGLVQCRADVSADNCASCIKASINESLTHCKNSKFSGFWLRWCYLHYAEEDFFGQWDNGMLMGTSFDNTSADDPSVVMKGINLMSQLSSEVPDQSSRFKTGVTDVGRKGKRYGLVQCNRDLSKSSCGKCLTSIEQFYTQVIGNQSSYVVLSQGCRLWYNNYKFYFNYTIQNNGSGTISSSPTGLLTSFTVGILILLILLSIPS